jgi:hypothetical protein
VALHLTAIFLIYKARARTIGARLIPERAFLNSDLTIVEKAFFTSSRRKVGYIMYAHNRRASVKRNFDRLGYDTSQNLALAGIDLPGRVLACPFREIAGAACHRGVAKIEALCLFSRAAFPCDDWSNCMVSLLGWTGERHIIKT